MLGKPAWLTRPVWGFGWASLLSDASHEMAAALVPAVVTAIVGPIAAPRLLGFIMGGGDALASAMKLVTGAVSDRVSRRKFFVVAGYAATALGTFLLSVVSTASGLIGVRALSSVGKGLREPPRDALMADIIEPRYYGRVFGFHRAMDTVGAIIGPLCAALFLGVASVATLAAAASIPGFLAALTILVFIPELQRSKITEHRSWRYSVGELPASFWYFFAIRVLFGVGFFNRTLLILRTQELISSHTLLTAGSLSALLYALFNVARAVSEYASGALSDTYGRTLPIAFGGFGLFGVASCLLLVPTSALWIWCCIFIMSGVATGFVTTLEKVVLADIVPAPLRATGFGVFQGGVGLLYLASSVLVGSLWTSGYANIGFALSAATSFAAMLCMFTVHRNGRVH